MAKIKVQDTEITIVSKNDDDYIIYEKNLGNYSKVVSFCEQNNS